MSAAPSAPPTRWLRAAERWLHTPTERGNLALFQGLFCGALAFQILLHFPEQLDFLHRRAAFDDALGLPVPYLQHAPLLGIVEVPALGPLAFCLVGAVLVAALLGAGFGARARLLLAVSLVAYFLYFGQILELGYVRRKTNPIPFLLLILLLAPELCRNTPAAVLRGLRHPGRYEAPAWPLVLVKLFLGLAYLAAGVSKLRNTGWSWANGDVLQANLLEHAISSDQTLALWMAGRPALCQATSIGTLVFELGFWTVLLLPRYGVWYGLAGLGFHSGIQLVMGIPYVQYWALAYLVFVDLPLLRRILGRRGVLDRLGPVGATNEPAPGPTMEGRLVPPEARRRVRDP